MKAIALSLVLGAVAMAQSTVNVSGRWQIEVQGQVPGGGGPTRLLQNLTLNQVGGTVVGELVAPGGGGGTASPTNNEIYDGKVEGQTVTFYVWRGNDKPAKTFYKGTLNARGDEITFVVTGGPPPRNPASPTSPQQLTAKRVK